MTGQPILVMITAPSTEVGKQLIDTLLEKRLAACGDILPAIRSLYTWKGEINDDEEVLLLAKSHSELFEDRLIPAVKSIHPYDVPEIIALPIVMGSQDYLEWMEEVTGD